MNDDTRTFFELVRSWIVEEAENAVPLERMLAAKRTVQARKIRVMADKATTVGEMTSELADNLAAEKLVLVTLTDKAKARRQELGSKEAAAADQEYKRLCGEIAETRDNIAELEDMVKESVSDKQEAIEMINQQTDNLARVARKDNSLVRREKMLDLREEQQKMREDILQIFPDDESDVRERAVKRLDKRERRLASRKDVVDAMWSHKKVTSAMEEVPNAQGVMDEIENSLK